MPLNDDSILTSIKKLLNIPAEDTDFDTDITIHINSAFATLHQLGLGPSDGYYIESAANLWSEFIGDVRHIQSVKTLVYYEVRLVFDPPATGPAVSAFKGQLEQLQWRLSKTVDTGLWLGPTTAFMWTLEGDNIWPPEAVEGDLGIYPASGNIWRRGHVV